MPHCASVRTSCCLFKRLDAGKGQEALWSELKLQDSRIPPDTIKTEGPCLSRGHPSHGGSWALARPVFSLQGVWAHRQIRDFMSQCQRQTPAGLARKQLSLLKQLELNIARECATSVLFLKSSGTKTQIHSYIKKKKKAWGFSQKFDSRVKRVKLKCTWIHL